MVVLASGDHLGISQKQMLQTSMLHQPFPALERDAPCIVCGKLFGALEALLDHGGACFKFVQGPDGGQQVANLSCLGYLQDESVPSALLPVA